MASYAELGGVAVAERWPAMSTHIIRAFTVILSVISGTVVLVWGLPQAHRYVLPWRWRVGILYVGLGLMLWPPFYFFFGHLDLEMVWIPIWAATSMTFVIGIKRLLGANTYAPGGSFQHPYDLGWIMRPRRPRNSNPTGEELIHDAVEDFIEDQSNPLAPILRFHRRQQENSESDADRG